MTTREGLDTGELVPQEMLATIGEAGITLTALRNEDVAPGNGVLVESVQTVLADLTPGTIVYFSHQHNGKQPTPTQEQVPKSIFGGGKLIVSRESGLVLVEGARVNLPPRQWSLMVFFADNPDVLLTRPQIHEAAWPELNFDDESNRLNVGVYRLRKLLGERVAPLIEPLKLKGYRFNSEFAPEVSSEETEQH